MWRVVLGHVATLREVEEHWSLADLLDACDAMDLQMAADASARKRVEAQCPSR